MTNEELCIMYQQGRKEAIEELYCQNARMIEKIIRRYQGLEDLDDLRQESYFGIVRAAELWKPVEGASFINYAAYWIKQAVHRYIENCGSAIRVPVNRRSQIGRYKRTVNDYRVRFGREPSERELCAVMELTPEQLEDLRRDALTLSVRSTSEVIGGDDDDFELEDTLAADIDIEQDVIDRVQHEEMASALWSCVDSLEPKQAAVIRARYQGDRTLTLKECGTALGVSPERVRALEAAGLRRLRRGDNVKRLRPFLTVDGARTMGLRNNGLSAFERNGSTQERAVMRLEDLAQMSLYQGRKLYLNESCI